MTLNVQNAKKIGIGGSKNLFNKTAATLNSTLTWAAGVDYASTGSVTSEYMSTSGGMTYSSNFYMLVFCYDSNKAYLGYITENGTLSKTSQGQPYEHAKTIPSGQNVVYIRVVWRSSYPQNAPDRNPGDVTDKDIMLNYGSVALPYEAYVAPSEVRAIHDKDSRLLWGRLEYDTKYEGDAWQQTYTGKNLFNKNATMAFSNSTTITVLDTGVRATVSQNTTGVAMAGFIIGNASDYVGKTLTIKSNITNTSGTTPRVYLGLSANNGTDRSSKASLSNSGEASWTVVEDVNRPKLIVVAYAAAIAEGASAGVYCDYTDLQVEVNSTATDYEPYVGGIPAPNPGYPQDIKVVQGPQTISLRCKNSLEYTLASLKTLNTGGTWNNNVYTWNGVTFTVNADLTISTNGTASTAAYLILTNDLSSLTPGGVYTLSGCPSGGSANSHSLCLYTGGSTYKSDIGSGLTFVYSAQTLIRVNIFGGTSANGLTFKPMLEYSKNLFDGALEAGIINGTTGASQDNNEFIRSQNYIPVKENTKYYIASTDLRVSDIFVYEYKDDYTYNLTSNKSIQNTDNARNFTTNSGTKYVRFRPNLKSGDIAMQFTLADMTPTPYEMYRAKKVGIDLRGVNLMPMDTAVIDNVTRQRMYSLAMPAGTYTVSYDLVSFEMGTNTSFGINFGLRGGNGTSYVIDLITQTIASGTTLGRYSKTFTINAPVTDVQQSDVRVAYTWWTNGARASISNIQIEPRDSASTYQPYHAPYELVRAGAYSDYIYKDGNDWKLKKKINKKTYNGSEDITYHSNRQGVDSFRMPTSDKILHGTAVLSPYFMPSNFDNYYNFCQYGEMCAHNSNDLSNFYASAPDSSITTVAQFQTWLSSHNTTAYYVQLAPTDTIITDAVLIEKLNSIHDWLNRYGYHADVVGDLPIVINQESL